MQGIHNREYRTQFQGGATNRVVLVADAPSADIQVVGRAGHTLFVTYIGLSLTTPAAQSMTLQDTAAVPVALVALPASAAAGFYFWNFGDEGAALSEGKGLSLSVSAAGLGAYVHIEWYFRQTAPLTLAELKQA